MCWMNMDQLSHKCPSHLSLSLCSCCWESSGAVIIHVHPHDTSLSVDWDFCLLVENGWIVVKKNNKSWNEDKLNSKFQSNSTTGSTRRNLRIWTAACNTWENMDVFRKWSMQQHWTSKPNHSCILHEIKQYQLLQCVPCFCLSLCLVFHTEPKTLLLLNGAFSVWFLWISCGVYVACRRYEDILKDTLENVLDA